MIKAFTDLTGQDVALSRLHNAIMNDRVHHAMLFCGPDGVGKFLAAQHLAQILVCQNPQSGSACNDCSACYKCHHSNHPDIVYLEPNEKGKITVDEIREANQVLYVQSLEAPFKVMIIRDADSMNPQAQNALLKTLEEPPGQSKIILTSAKPQAFLGTILSRCQRVDFKPVPLENIQKLLQAKTDLDEASAHLIAALAQGSPAQALSSDPEEIMQRRDYVAEIDRKLNTRERRQAATAIAVATELSGEKDELSARLQLLGVWIRDQILFAAQADISTVANIDRHNDLQFLANDRGLPQLLQRAKFIEEAQTKLSQPFNLNVGLIVEQLCLSLVGLNGSIR
ncbi:MAG: DNA polymerase III subunit delta' [Myxococcota bacterium]|nr:DNA polymerase III subunit delta' [Myxococcota bacterium]